jgi:hypothetical protein
MYTVRSKQLALDLELAKTRNRPAGLEEVKWHQLVEYLEVREAGTGRVEVERAQEPEEKSTEGEIMWTQEESRQCVPQDHWGGMGGNQSLSALHGRQVQPSCTRGTQRRCLLCCHPRTKAWRIYQQVFLSCTYFYFFTYI